MTRLLRGLAAGTYGASNTGPGQEPAATAGTIFDGTDTYPGDINSGPTDTTYRLRSSGSPYGTNASILTPPSGVEVLNYNGEAVTLNGTVEISADDVTIGGVTIHLSGTQDDSVVGASLTSGSTSTYIDRTTIRNSHLRNNGGRHGVSFIGNVKDASLLNLEIERYGSNTWGGDPSDIWLQEGGAGDAYFPTGILVANVKLVSTAGGTHDTIQYQGVGEVHTAYVSFEGARSENWVDLKPRASGTGPYTFSRCVFPARGASGSNTFLTRANALLMDCVFDASGTGQSALIIGNSGMAKGDGPTLVRLVRCYWIDTIGADTNMINWTSNGTEADPAVDFIGCHSDGGEFENKTNAGWVRWINCKLTDTTFTHHVDEDGFVCDNNVISGGAGWGACT